METIDGHTFDETKLTGGWVIDAGCRWWNFSKHFEKVYALDIENFDDVPEGVIFKNAALQNVNAEIEAHFFGKGDGNFIKGLNGIPGNLPDRPCETRPVKSITLQDIYNEIGTDIDILKMDIESSEYEILLNIDPIPKQITVEFHQHTTPEKHNQYIDQIMDHLCRHYNASLYVREWPRYRFMDCLFIRKDI